MKILTIFGIISVKGPASINSGERHDVVKQWT